MLDKFTLYEIDELQSALGHLFDQKAFPLEIVSPRIQKILAKQRWVNGSDLLSDLVKITDSKNIDEARKKILDKKASLEALTPTVPQNIRELEEAYAKEKDEKEKERIKAELVRAKEQHRRAQQIFLNTPQDIKSPEMTPEEEANLNNLIQNQIKRDPSGYANSLAEEIVKQNLTPEMAPEQIEVLRANAKLVSINFVDKALGLESKTETLKDALKIAWAQNPIHVAASLVNPKNPLIGEKTARAAQATALTLEHDHLVARNLLARFVPEKILQSFYPTANEIIYFEVADKPSERSVVSVKKESFTDLGLKLEDSNLQILDFAKDKAWNTLKEKTWQVLDRTFENTPWYSGAKEAVAKYVPGLVKPGVPVVPAEAIQQGLSLLWNKQGVRVLTSTVPDIASALSISFKKDVLLSPAFNLKMWSFSFSRVAFTAAEGVTGQALGINIGNFGISLVKGGEKGTQLLLNLGAKAAPATKGLVAKGVSAIAAKLGLTSAITAITQALGSFAPIVGNILALIATWLAQKAIGPIINWIQKHKEDLAIIGGILMAGGLIFRSVPLLISGTLMAVPGLMAGRALAGIGARAFFFGRQIGKSLAFTIGTPVIVAVVVFPILVALILFIINSGAYIVPWSTSGLPGLSENPYIGVQKVAEPPGPFKNSDIPFTVKYTVTITAKKSTLTNIKIEYKCEVIKEGSKPPCPDISGTIPSPAADFTVSPATPFSFSYEVSYTSDVYNDSLVMDTITVTADTPDEESQTTSGSASIIIGSPPNKCFVLVGDNWPANFLANLQAAIVKITTDHPAYAAKVCSGGNINIEYDPTPHTYWGYHHYHPNTVDITLYSGGLGSQLNAEYILIHEATHHLSYVMGDLYSQYTHYPGIDSERPICSYTPDTNDPAEAFAEAAALYGSEKPFPCFTSGSFKGNYPIHWSFEDTVIFR